MDSEYKRRLQMLQDSAMGVSPTQRQQMGNSFEAPVTPVDTSVSPEDQKRIREAQLKLLMNAKSQDERLPVDAMRPQGSSAQDEDAMYNELMLDEPKPPVRFNKLFRK